jgi:hypothetical protein
LLTIWQWFSLNCHPEQASFAQRGIWASRAMLRRFAGVNEMGAHGRNPERSEGSNPAAGSLAWQTEPLPTIFMISIGTTLTSLAYHRLTPGRGVSIPVAGAHMQRFALSLLGFCLAVSLFAHADDWSKTYNITGKPDLRVQGSDANLHVDTWDQNTIDVHVTSSHYKIGEGGITIYEHQTGDSVEIELRYPHHHFPISVQIGSYRVDVDVHMPREGRVNLHTGDGDIRLENFKGNMELESGDGHEEIESVDGSLRARTSDGHISASGRFDALDLNTGDGRIEARVQPGSMITSDWTIRTGDGSVTLDLPDNFAADVDLRTGDGSINVDLPVTVQGNLAGNIIHGKLNGGGNLLTVHTGDGSIRIDKS